MASTRNSASSSLSSNSLQQQQQRRSLLSPKHDSAVSIGQAGARADARRISLRRSFQSSEAAFVEDDLAEFLAEQPSYTEQSSYTDTMGPVYRLYPHQTASGRRDIRQASDSTITRPTSRIQDHIFHQQQQRRPEQADIAYGVSNLDDFHASSDHPTRPVAQDFQDRRQSSQPLSSRPLSPTSIYAKPSHSNLSQASSPSEAPKTWTRNSIRIPPRTSSSGQNNTAKPSNADSSINEILHRMPEAPRKSTSSTIPESEPSSPDAMTDRHYGVGDGSSRDSRDSLDTTATSVHTLPPLQNKGLDPNDAHALEPLIEDDPRSFDLVEPPQEAGNVGMYALEKQADLLLSKEHLTEIFNNSKLLQKFTGFLNSHRPQSIPLLIYYLDALKALRAIKYANAVAEALEPITTCDFTKEIVQQTNNASLEEKANKAFEILVREDLPAYITYTWIQVVSTSISRRITGTLAPHLREASEGLAEVFCLTDPSRPDNPIVFASEEFSRTTQYGMGYSIGRNCRFLQGPRTDPNSPRRLAEACKSGVEQSEVFVNYRRDGSPFLNLLMIAPLMDSKGTVRYFIGAQVDVSGLLKTCSELPGLAKLVEEEIEQSVDNAQKKKSKKDEFQELSEMFNGVELDTVRRRGGSMHREYVDNEDAESIKGGADRGRPRLMLSDPSQEILDKQTEKIAPGVPAVDKDRVNGKLAGVYQNYLLIRPAPSMRILFTSPSLRVPGILQSPFLHRIGGSPRVRADLSAALEEGRGVTAKIRWLARPDEDGEGEGRPRWIHCTPLIGHTGAVGVWMVVLIDEEGSRESISANRRFRTAPPVATSIGGKDWEPPTARTTGQNERRQLNAYDADTQRRGAGSGANAPNSANYFNNYPNHNVHSSAASIDRRPSNASLTGPLTSSREYPPSASQFSLHAGQKSPASSRAQSMTNRDGDGANLSALSGHVAGQYNRPENIRRDTGESQSFSVRTR